MPTLDGVPCGFALRNCPTRNETGCLVVENNNHANLLFYNGTSWSNPTVVSNDIGMASNVYRPYDIAYESVSGDLLAAYWSAAESKIGFRTASSGTVSAQSLLPLATTTQLYWIQLFANPQTDDIGLLAIDSAYRLHSAFWNGTSWNTPTILTSSATHYLKQCAVGAYESISGNAIVVYGTSGSNDLKYRTRTSSTWSTEQIAQNIGAKAYWVRLAAHPYSNTILCATIDNAYDINTLFWNGTTWSVPQELETTATGFEPPQRMDLAYQGCGPKAIIAYNDNISNTRLRYRIWDGSTWGAEQTDTNHNDLFYKVTLKTGPGYGELLSLDWDAWYGTNSRHSYGSSWGDCQEIYNAGPTSMPCGGSDIAVPATPHLTPTAIPYFNDFEGAIGPEWSNNLVTNNTTFTKFAGRHFRRPVELALNTTIGETYDVSFDLFCIDSWNGNLPNGSSAPDYFLILANGTEIFRHTFTHEFANSQGASYPYPYDFIGDYGFGGAQDGIYRKVETSFTAQSTTTTLTFAAQLESENELGVNDESWGLDQISIKPTPFINVSSAKGLFINTVTNADTYGGSIHWADFNNDGWSDAIVTGDSSSKLLINTEGSPGRTFTVSNFGDGNICHQGAVLDADNDGDIDFFGLTSNRLPCLFLNNGSGTFTNHFDSGYNLPNINKGLAAGDVNRDGICDIVMFSGNGNWIGINNGESDPEFTETTKVTDGMVDLGDVGTGDYCSSGDVNNDGYLDFFFHFGGGKLFISDGDGTYTENNHGISIATNASTPIGSAWGDFDNDGNLDLFCPNLAEGCVGTLWRNDCFVNGQFTGNFTDITPTTGLGFNTVKDYFPDKPGTRSAVWGDYDNDGYLDLFVVGVQNNNYLFHNQGNGTFNRVGGGILASGTFVDASFCDYDNDGDLDLFLTRENGSLALYENRTNNTNYLKLHIVGRGAGGTNCAAIGTRVEVWDETGTTRLGRRDVGVARGFGGTEPLWIHFGGVDPNSNYQVKIFFTSSPVATPTKPSTASAILGGPAIPQALNAEETLTGTIKRWKEVQRKSSGGN